MSYRLRNIGIAVALAVLAALLTIFYVTNYERPAGRGPRSRLVAARDVAVGVRRRGGGDRRLLRAVEVAKRNVVPGAISQPDQIETLVATERIYEGEQVTLNRFRPLGEQGIKAQLKGRLRAFELAGSEHQLLLGTLEGDHVDFVGSLEVGNGVTLTKVVLRDLLVLKAPNSGAVESQARRRSRTKGFGDPPADRRAGAEALPRRHPGDWALQLRPVTDAADSRNTVDGSASVMGLVKSRRSR